MEKQIWFSGFTIAILVAACGGSPDRPQSPPASEGDSVSRCGEADTGGLDAIATATGRPRIVDLDFDPSKFVATCAQLVVTVTVENGAQEPLLYRWTVTSPEGNPPTLTPSGASLDFSARLPGDFQGLVEVCLPPPATDPDCARLSFPIHVVPGPDEDHDGTPDLCEETCVPACEGRTCGPDPVCGASCGTCPEGQICIPLGFCAIPEPN
jgi:hypothetical protein